MNVFFHGVVVSVSGEYRSRILHIKVSLKLLSQELLLMAANFSQNVLGTFSHYKAVYLEHSDFGESLLRFRNDDYTKT